MARHQPPSLGQLKRGDRLILINADNSRRVVEVTSVGAGRASGRNVGPAGPEGRIQKIYSGSILCRVGEPEIKWAGNLIAGDLIYTPSHKSGLQYGRVAANKDGSLVLLRWDESAANWLKRPQEIPGDSQWFSHDSEPGALERFFERIREDRSRWEASNGRSGYKRKQGSDEYYWHSKERRWDLHKPTPTYFQPPSKWERGSAED